ncbi:MAG: PQQ-dependent sugar dehydrogenase [Desulfomicrobium sp.]|nr:PQQ-dependent sugar dehydrogenase [Desulfomicrobium sp.]
MKKGVFSHGGSLLAAVFLGFMLVLLANPAGAEEFSSRHHRFRVTTVAGGLEHPWSLAFLPGGDMLVSERPGRLRIIRGGVLQDAPVQGLPQIRARGQGGLLDLLPHPDFARNHILFFSYSAEYGNGVTTHVARARLEHDTLKDVNVIFRAEPASTGRVHFGSRLSHDRQGRLYVSVGDRGQMRRAQQLDDHAGKILRINEDGSVPEDNPFVGQENAWTEIYSYGHRNPQGMAVHPKTGEIWTHEHGPRGGDEINIIHPGVNYGWPVVTLGIDYTGFSIGDGLKHMPGMEDPIHEWTPSIAPSGMAFYTGDAFGAWKGNLFVGALSHRHLARLELSGQVVVGEERLLESLGLRIRDVRVGPEGSLWLLTDHDPGQVLRLDPLD